MEIVNFFVYPYGIVYQRSEQYKRKSLKEFYGKHFDRLKKTYSIR